jgi:arylsulfatase A
MNRREFISSVGAGMLMMHQVAVGQNMAASQSVIHKGTNAAKGIKAKPNIVFFLVDDMGYGDVSCLNPEGKIATPNFDRLASEGMVFTDAHSTSAVCTPTRYSILTGRYNWRTRLQGGVLGPYGDPLIAKDRFTVGDMLKRHGYYTACIGKWHLGIDWDFEKNNKDFWSGDWVKDKSSFEATDEQRAKWQAAFGKPFSDGPTKHGFDYYFGVDVPNYPPYCYIENDRTVGVPSEFLPERLLGNNLASKFGPAMPYWHFEQLLPTFAQKADKCIKQCAEEKKHFFLYLPMTSPHTPLSVNKQWIGKSGLNNLYADLVMETDDIFGQVLNSLKEHGVEDNTLVIFTSDNGCAPYIDVAQMEAQGHYPSGQFRGYKSDAWDGGHRVPCIARWPGVIEPGSDCNQLVCLSDLMATCAEILGEKLPDNAGEDSVSMLPLFSGVDIAIRDNVVHHSIAGRFAIRDGRWKLVLCPGSGGWALSDSNAVSEGLPLIQLYDIKNDPGENNNIYAEHPERVKTMIEMLRKIVSDGRSTPGVRQKNDVEVEIWKFRKTPGVDMTALDDYI